MSPYVCLRALVVVGFFFSLLHAALMQGTNGPGVRWVIRDEAGVAVVEVGCGATGLFFFFLLGPLLYYTCDSGVCDFRRGRDVCSIEDFLWGRHGSWWVGSRTG